jgi:hypothetical protein
MNKAVNEIAMGKPHWLGASLSAKGQDARRNSRLVKYQRRCGVQDRPRPADVLRVGGCLNVLLGDCQLTTQGSQTLSQVGSSRRERNTPKDLTETCGSNGLKTLVRRKYKQEGL